MINIRLNRIYFRNDLLILHVSVIDGAVEREYDLNIPFQDAPTLADLKAVALDAVNLYKAEKATRSLVEQYLGQTFREDQLA